MKNPVRPPLGIKPREIYEEGVRKNRLEEIYNAMIRYFNENLEIPIEWIEEYNDLIKILYTKENKELINSISEDKTASFRKMQDYEAEKKEKIVNFKKYDKNDIREGDVYSFSNSEGDVLAEIIKREGELEIALLKGNYWKPAYECIRNNYLTDFGAILIYRLNK